MEDNIDTTPQASEAQPQTAPQMAGTVAMNDPVYNTPPESSFNMDSVVNSDGTMKEGWTNGYEGGSGLGKYKTFNDLVNGFINANKLIGKKSEPMSKPSADATPEQIQAWRDHLGVPATAEGYQLPDEFNKDTADMDSFKEFADFAHKNDIPLETAKEILRFQERYAAKNNENFARKIDEMGREAKKYFQAEWGGHYDRNVVMLQDGLKRAGVDLNSPDMQVALNTPFILEALYDKISAMQSGSMPNTSMMQVSANDAKSQIMSMIGKYGSIDRMPQEVRQTYTRLIGQKNLHW